MIFRWGTTEARSSVNGVPVDQVKRCVRAGVGEQPRALADDHGEGEQGHLVDKVVVKQLVRAAADWILMLIRTNVRRRKRGRRPFPIA
jgi:hypothetical protein